MVCKPVISVYVLLSFHTRGKSGIILPRRGSGTVLLHCRHSERKMHRWHYLEPAGNVFKLNKANGGQLFTASKANFHFVLSTLL